MTRFTIFCIVLLLIINRMAARNPPPEPSSTDFTEIYGLTCDTIERSQISFQELAAKQPSGGFHVVYSIATNLECEDRNPFHEEVDGVPLTPGNNECFQLKLSVTGAKVTFTMENEQTYGVFQRVCRDGVQSANDLEKHLDDFLLCDGPDRLRMQLVWSDRDMHVLTLCQFNTDTLSRHASMFILSQNKQLSENSKDILENQLMSPRKIPQCALAAHRIC